MKLSKRKVLEAQRTIDHVNANVNDLCWIIDGRLRKASPMVLNRLKRELRAYNMHTGEWNE